MSSDAPDVLSMSTEVTFKRLAMTCATTDLVVFGMISSIYGPLLLSFAHRYNLSLPTAGVVLSVHFVGAFCGVPMGWLAMKRWAGNVVLTAALLLMAVGAVGAALSPNWSTLLVSVFVIGLGFGSVDFSLNSLLVRTRSGGRARRLSLANAGYGVGAVIGPVLIVLVHPHNFHYLFAVVAVLAVVLSLGNRGLHAPRLHATAHYDEGTLSGARRRTILVTFIVAYVLYVAAETTTAGWIAPQLHRLGSTTTIASLVTAGFWLGLALGRVLAGPLNRLHSDRRLVLVGLIVAAMLCLGAEAIGAAPYLYPLVGLSLALVYPMGLIWYTSLCPHDANGLALVILFMMIGGVIGPAIESLMVSTFGIHVVPIVLAGFAALDAAAFASALRFRAPALA